jgi:hypothetical protein
LGSRVVKYIIIIYNKIDENFGGFFHQIKVCQPIGGKDSKQPVIQQVGGLDAFLYEAAKNFYLFSNIQEQN